MLSTSNSSGTQVTEFFLVGFPGFQSWQHWLSIPLAFLLLLAVSANCILLITIYREQSLHESMYYFLSILAVVDLVLSMITTPKILTILWFDARSIGLPACFTQMFFVHCFLWVESGIFVAMAVDRYIAICSPLRYAAIVTDRFIVKAIVIIFLRSFFTTLPMPLLTGQLHYCSEQNIKYSFCANLAVAKLACDDIRLSSLYQLAMAWTVLGGDLMLIFLSYCLILLSVTRLRVQGATTKALSTCSSHLILISFFYSILLVLVLTNKAADKVSVDIPVMFNSLHLLLPPAINPIVYGLRTKEINQGTRKLFSNIC